MLPPAAVPTLTSPDEAAARPAMAALSVAYHGANPAVCQAFADGLRQLPDDDALQYHEHAFNMAPLVLEARGLDVTEAERERITACTDLRQLKKWIRRAVTAEKTSDLFR